MIATLSQFDLDHFSEIFVGRSQWFSACLIRLIAKADPDNREQLRLAYPDHVAAFERWKKTGDAREKTNG